MNLKKRLVIWTEIINIYPRNYMKSGKNDRKLNLKLKIKFFLGWQKY